MSIQALQQTAAAILVPRTSTVQRAAAAAEPGHSATGGRTDGTPSARAASLRETPWAVRRLDRGGHRLWTGIALGAPRPAGLPREVCRGRAVGADVLPRLWVPAAGLEHGGSGGAGGCRVRHRRVQPTLPCPLARRGPADVVRADGAWGHVRLG